MPLQKGVVTCAICNHYPGAHMCKNVLVCLSCELEITLLHGNYLIRKIDKALGRRVPTVYQQEHYDNVLAKHLQGTD